MAITAVSFNPGLPRVAYRANQGTSSYHALSALVRYRASRAQLQFAYTWGQIDNQSEPLTGDFFDLSFTRLTAGEGRGVSSAFPRQFDSSVDRANSDFDQRHNVVVFSIWDLPGTRLPFRNWRFAQLAAFRSGFPYSVNVPIVFAGTGGVILNNRADLVGAISNPAPVPGGEFCSIARPSVSPRGDFSVIQAAMPFADPASTMSISL